MEASERRADAPLAIEERTDGDERVISLAGELDLSNADRLRDALHGAMRSGATRVVVDLSGLGFIDSTGLRTLLRGQQASRADSNILSFVRARGQVERVMRMAGIEDELTYVD
jgi:anti-sigma B factor antagonist